MPNYGDIRLNLPPDWNRRSMFNKALINSTIGHKEGVSEVRRKDQPEQKHAFAWVDLTNRVDVDQNRDDGYVFVKKQDGWIADRWEFNAEGFLYCDGQVLMALPEDKWNEVAAEREAQQESTRPSAPVRDDVHDRAAKFGATVESDVPLGRRGRAAMGR